MQVEANGMDELTLQNGRYDGIFHLVTAALGASDHYTLENNEARSEPVELAIEVGMPQTARTTQHAFRSCMVKLVPGTR